MKRIEELEDQVLELSLKIKYLEVAGSRDIVFGPSPTKDLPFWDSGIRC